MSPSPAREEFVARYRVESPEPLDRVAETIAGEQSSGTFLSIAGETEEVKLRSRARVVRVTPLDEAPRATLPSAAMARSGRTGPCRRGEIEIAFPVANVGPNLTTLMATVCGNLYELGEVTGLRLLDLDLPAAYARQFPGP